MMGMPDLLPRLRYEKLEDLNMKTRYEYADVMCGFVLETLERYGPLPLEGLVYFVGKNYPIVTRKTDLGDVVLMHSDVILLEGSCFYTVGQLADKTVVKIPAPHDYADAYYHLFEMFTLLREHPELAGTPLSMLEDLYPKRYTGTDI